MGVVSRMQGWVESMGMASDSGCKVGINTLYRLPHKILLTSYTLVSALF